MLDQCSIAAGAAGVVVGDEADSAFVDELAEAMGWHRHWNRVPVIVLV